MGAINADQWNELRTGAHAWLLWHEEPAFSTLGKRCLNWLSQEEKRRGERFSTEQRRQQYLASRVLCRAALSSYTDVEPSQWVFVTGKHGKPLIAEPPQFTPLRFNLARTSGLTICLVSRLGDVGVDTEDTARPINVAQVTQNFLSPSDQMLFQQMSARERTSRFFDHWVLREAYFKGTGKGIVDVPEPFGIRFSKNNEPLPIGRWRLFLHRPSAHHVAAAAIHVPRLYAPVMLHWHSAAKLMPLALKPKANEGGSA